MAVGVVMLLLGLIQLGISLYFTSLVFRLPAWLSQLLSGAATACGIDGGSCRRVVETPYARIFFGQPNFLVGVFWGLLVALLAACYLATGVWHLWAICVGVSVASVVVAIYLTWALVSKLRELCPL